MYDQPTLNTPPELCPVVNARESCIVMKRPRVLLDANAWVPFGVSTCFDNTKKRANVLQHCFTAECGGS